MNNPIMKKKPILCLDFDGVIHSYTSGWQGADKISDPPVIGALDFIVEASKWFNVAIYSSRSGQEGGIQAMQEWLAEHVLKCPGYNGDRRLAEAFVTGVIEWPQEKPPAMVTLDDRAITFTGEWPAMETLLRFKPWNKK